ncbi:uncharacterized protein LOC142322657 [Lycorma delicatula]|uniref:uncharacterized protein LOC142322657 n=1 Tax=Lycorma delicatula TaxID=130591 RepID=UPI003F51101E
MMFCWLHLTLSVSFLKVLWVVVAAAAAVTSDSSDSGKEKDITVGDNKSSVPLEGNIALLPTFRTLISPEFPKMTSFANEDLSVQNNNNNNNNNDDDRQLERVELNNFKFDKNETVNSNDDGIFVNNVNNSDVSKIENCDKYCLEAQKNKLHLNIHDIGLKNEDKDSFKLSAIDHINDHVSSLEMRQEESKLYHHGRMGAYELDNHNTNSNNNNNSSSNTFADIPYLKSTQIDQISLLQNKEYRSSTSVDDLSSFPSSPINGDQSADYRAGSVSNNRTVGTYVSASLKNGNDSLKDTDETDVKQKTNSNVDIDIPLSPEKVGKDSSIIFKNSLKSNKSKTLQESKSFTKNVSNPVVKYSDESKKKALINHLSDDITENTKSQQLGIVPNDDTSFLMSDEPEDSAGREKSHSAIAVPEVVSEEEDIFPLHDNSSVNVGGVNGSLVETNETFSTTNADGHTMKSIEGTSGFNIAIISGIAVGILIISSVIGAVSFVVYRHRYWNKPQTLSDKCSNADSSGYIDDSTLRDNSEEMYSLDNDSFLNSLEAMTIQNYWTDNVKHTKL